MANEKKVMPTAPVDVEEKKEGVCVCPMVIMDSAQDGICCRLLWRTSLPLRDSTAPPSLVSSVNLTSIPSSPVFKLLVKILKSTGLRVEPCGTPLVNHLPCESGSSL
ncbi:uncharacterized protein GJ701_002013 [Geothlypis trichas]